LISRRFLRPFRPPAPGATRRRVDGNRPSGYFPSPLIVAVVSRLTALPRTTLVVARFTAPAPARLRHVGRLRLRHGRLTWARQAAASRYSVMVSAGSAWWTGTVARPSLRLTGKLPKARRVTVLVSALDRATEAGPLTRKVLTAR
jgi:hypothetical protein